MLVIRPIQAANLCDRRKDMKLTGFVEALVANTKERYTLIIYKKIWLLSNFLNILGLDET